MTVEEYAELQAAANAALAAELLQILNIFRVPALTALDWEVLLDLLWDLIEPALLASAELGRRFYDSQRAIHAPGEPVHPVPLAAYRREWLSEALAPERVVMSRPGASDSDAARTVLRALKEVENAGRRTILRPIREDDPELRDRVVKGWARVATGRETCAFCLMLVSRGPVYMTADNAGLDADDTTAQDLFERGDQAALDELMTRWHPGCDCKVVPVFDRASWPGREAWLRAELIWREATRGYSGKDAMNAFRRAIERGDVDIIAMSIAA